MFRVALILVFLAAASFCSAQLNYSTGWGKRAFNPATISDNNCKSCVDSVMMLYKLIQSEAQKLVECEHFTK